MEEMHMTTLISIRLPDGLEKDLKKLALMTDRSKTYLICKAVESYLLEYADYQVALDRLRDKNDTIISGSEMRKRLGL